VQTFRSYPFILLLFQFCSSCPTSILVSKQTPICLKHHRKSRKRHSPYFSTTRNPATIPPSKSLRHISTKPTSENHQSIPTGPHVSSHQKVTHQPKPFDPTTNKPHSQTWSSSFKRFFTRHHPLESQRYHPNKWLKRQPIPRPLWVPPLSQCNTTPPCRLRVPRRQPTPPEQYRKNSLMSISPCRPKAPAHSHHKTTAVATNSQSIKPTSEVTR